MDNTNHGSAGNLNPQSHNRFISGVTDAVIKTMLWPEAQGVVAVRFKVKNNTGGVVGDVVKVVFDATPVDDASDTTQAAAWLAPAVADPELDVEYFELQLGGQGVTNGYVPEWSEWFYFTEPLLRADFLAEQAHTYDIVAEVR